MQFSMWCLAGTPLIMGADLRKLDPEMEKLLKNEQLISINQDRECRPPYLVGKRSVTVPQEDTDMAVELLRLVKDKLYTFIKHLSGNEFAVAYYNLFEEERKVNFIFADAGVPYGSGYGLSMQDVFTGESLGVKRDYHIVDVPGHDCRVYKCRLVYCGQDKCDG